MLVDGVLVGVGGCMGRMLPLLLLLVSRVAEERSPILTVARNRLMLLLRVLLLL